MQAVTIVVVGFTTIRSNRLEAQFFAVHLVANPEDIILGAVIESREDFEVFPEAFAQTESIK